MSIYREIDNQGQAAGEIGTMSRAQCALPIARIYVQPAATADSVAVTDTRKRGGGISDNADVQELLTNEQKAEAQGLWDIAGWDGKPAMLTGSVVVNVPKSRLDTNGGPFTLEQIQKYVTKGIPAGVVPIIRFTEN